MPFGLWKSKWELLLEEMNRRDTKWRDERAEVEEKRSEERAKAEAKWREERAATEERQSEERAMAEAARREERVAAEEKRNEERAAADAEWREYCTRKEAEFTETMRKSDARWDEFIVRSEERHAELLDRLAKNHNETMAGIKIAIEELRALRREVHEGTDAINALTEAVLKLIDRFDEWEGRPPGSGRMGPRSA